MGLNTGVDCKGYNSCRYYNAVMRYIREFFLAIGLIGVIISVIYQGRGLPGILGLIMLLIVVGYGIYSIYKILDRNHTTRHSADPDG